ncbi:MAG: Gfo/Idh/MocA family protein [Bdellovibrionales bacterium]
MNVAIIGCGLIGKKRAKALQGDTLVAVCDSNVDGAQAVGVEAARGEGTAPPVRIYESWQTCLEHPDLQAVIVATPHHLLPQITRAAVDRGLAVLVEKPAGRNPFELRELVEFVEAKVGLVRVGFNHRYHPAFRQVAAIQSGEDLGRFMFLRGRYGHGGRLGMEKEWRAKPELSGGGELIDQGVHMIDLARLWLKRVTHVQGWSHRYFWDMPVEDNGFMLLRNDENQAAHLQVSCTEWKNLFSFELYFERAKLVVDGLGGSYGVERLSHYRMLPQMGPPETVIHEYPRGDDSWEYEWREFQKDVRERRQPEASLSDALAALQVVSEVYQQSREGK